MKMIRMRADRCFGIFQIFFQISAAILFLSCVCICDSAEEALDSVAEGVMKDGTDHDRGGRFPGSDARGCNDQTGKVLKAFRERKHVI